MKTYVYKICDCTISIAAHAVDCVVWGMWSKERYRREGEVRQLSSNAEKNENERSSVKKNLLQLSHFEDVYIGLLLDVLSEAMPCCFVENKVGRLWR